MKHTGHLAKMFKGDKYARPTPLGDEFLSVSKPMLWCGTCCEWWNASLAEWQQPACMPRCCCCTFMHKDHSPDGSCLFAPTKYTPFPVSKETADETHDPSHQH